MAIARSLLGFIRSRGWCFDARRAPLFAEEYGAGADVLTHDAPRSGELPVNEDEQGLGYSPIDERLLPQTLGLRKLLSHLTLQAQLSCLQNISPCS